MAFKSLEINMALGNRDERKEKEKGEMDQITWWPKQIPRTLMPIAFSVCSK